MSLQKWSLLIVKIEPISQSRVQNINTKHKKKLYSLPRSHTRTHNMQMVIQRDRCALDAGKLYSQQQQQRLEEKYHKRI